MIVSINFHVPSIYGLTSLRFGVVGFGEATTRLMCPAIIRRGFEVSAVVDVLPIETIKERFSMVGIEPSYFSPKRFERFLELVDAVYVASPNSSHFWYSTRALKAGKHVLCEKPIVCSMEEGESLRSIIEECKHLYGCRYMPVDHYLYKEEVLRLLRRPPSDVIWAEMRIIEERRPEESGRGWLLKTECGGVGMDLMVHLLTIASHLSESLTLRKAWRLSDRRGEAETYMAALYEASGGMWHSNGRLWVEVAKGLPTVRKEIVVKTSDGHTLEIDLTSQNVVGGVQRRPQVRREYIHIIDDFTAYVDGSSEPVISTDKTLHATLLAVKARRSAHTEYLESQIM